MIGRFLYGAVFTVLLPWVFFRMWLRSFKVPAYRRRWAERLGYPPLPPLENAIWIHAVSVGESISAVPLVHALRQRYPQNPILVTTTTPTGSDRVQAAFKDLLGTQIFHCYMPYDLTWTLRRFFTRIHPKLLVIMETELWPNLLMACEKRRIPVLIANGRLSPTSARRYGYIRSFIKRIVRPIQVVAAQSSIDATRFAELGVAPEKIYETGNIKFDLQLPAYLQDAGAELRQELGTDRFVWIAASTHEGEEQIILDAFRELKAKWPHLLLLLVPRHPDRFNKVAALCSDKGWAVARRSLKHAVTPKTDIFLGDTMGELMLFYAASDVAFVGGSFAMVGGHNLLEPAALGLPILTGPQLFNFLAISEMLLDAKGLVVVPEPTEMSVQLDSLLSHPDRRESLGEQAKQVVEKNRGALNKLVERIEFVLQQGERSH